MAYEKIEDLPNDVKEKLPQGAQNIFFTAYNSASSDGMSDHAAQDVAWNSLRTSYEEGSDGKWHPRPQVGAHRSPTGTMPGA